MSIQSLTLGSVNREGSTRGVWHVAVLAAAEDGDTTLVTKAADFTVV